MARVKLELNPKTAQYFIASITGAVIIHGDGQGGIVSLRAGDWIKENVAVSLTDRGYEVTVIPRKE